MPWLVMHLGDIPFAEKIIQVQNWSTVKSSKWFNEAHILEILMIFVATLLGYLLELKEDSVIHAQTMNHVTNNVRHSIKKPERWPEANSRPHLTWLILTRSMWHSKYCRGDGTDDSALMDVDIYLSANNYSRKLKRFWRISIELRPFVPARSAWATCQSLQCTCAHNISRMKMTSIHSSHRLFQW